MRLAFARKSVCHVQNRNETRRYGNGDFYQVHLRTLRFHSPASQGDHTTHITISHCNGQTQCVDSPSTRIILSRATVQATTSQCNARSHSIPQRQTICEITSSFICTSAMIVTASSPPSASLSGPIPPGRRSGSNPRRLTMISPFATPRIKLCVWQLHNFEFGRNPAPKSAFISSAS